MIHEAFVNQLQATESHRRRRLVETWLITNETAGSASVRGRIELLLGDDCRGGVGERGQGMFGGEVKGEVENATHEMLTCATRELKSME